ncbi:AI-2E family transporter [Kaistia sp. K-TC2]|uniref:AI-2E family transporter n=1 Tax=Kaistia nematophila TaxID=2994654 RepID=A0A9X3IK71_9HYPH|nr:AI-2E family transporter [Kaistia nematophila]MCX5568206.1 AI-2E family transporter [Kaistia nematophila]
MFQDEGAPLKLSRSSLSGEDVIQLAIRLGLLALLLYWTLVLIQPFIPILTWSVVLAVAFNPLYRELARLLGGRRKLAAVILTAIGFGIVIGPAAWLGLSAVDGFRDLSNWVSSGGLVIPSPPQSIKDWPLFGVQLYEWWDKASVNFSAILQEVLPSLKPIATTILGLAGDAGLATLQFLVSVTLVGFLLLHGPQLVSASRDFLFKLVPDQSEHFVELTGATIRAVSQGIIGVAIIQALLAGIGFKLAGLPAAGLLAFAVLLLSIVQIGAFLVLLPVFVWIWMTKDVSTALLLTIYLTIVGLLDNVLKPLMMGRGLTTPTLVILIGVIGGTLAHGMLGLFIGPVILAVVWELTGAWIRSGHARRQRSQDAEPHQGPP